MHSSRSFSAAHIHIIVKGCWVLSRQVRPPGDLPGVKDEEAPLTEGSLTASRRAPPASRRSMDSRRSPSGRSEVRPKHGLCRRMSSHLNESQRPSASSFPASQDGCEDEPAFALRKCVPGAQASVSASRSLHHL